MNIFLLHSDPVIAAQMQCNVHVVKMVTESAQMLSTAHRLIKGTPQYDISNKGRKTLRLMLENDEHIFYKAVHVKHPCTLWSLESTANYNWHYKHFVALCEEYTYRYGKIHKSDAQLRKILETPPTGIPERGLTPFKLAMKEFPECIVKDDPVESYRRFYMSKQERFKMVWSKRERPDWFVVS
jgi:hypothetical protein